MGNKPRKMSKIRIVLQSLLNGLSYKAIARSHNISRNTVRGHHRFIASRNLAIPELLNMEDTELEDLFYKVSVKDKLSSDLKDKEAYYSAEINRPHVTVQLLYEEYQATGGQLSRSGFYDQLSKLKVKEVSYTKQRPPGERLEVDYAGKKLTIISEDGEEIKCEVLVCVLPYSNLIYCEAQSNQGQVNYINGIGRALLYIGKKPKEILSDNLKSGIKRSNRYEPILTELCEEASQYYGIHITATRVAKPKDKPNVERSVQIVYQRIYAKIRNNEVRSIEELNVLIKRELDLLNGRIVNNTSRRQKYETEESEKMLPLKVNQLMEIKKTRTGKVGKNYHIELTEDKVNYSVPYQNAGEEIKMFYSETTVEIYFKGSRIALHQRSKTTKYVTEENHMPPNHKAAKELNGHTKDSIIILATPIGEHVVEVIQKVMERNPYVQQGFKSALGIINLAKKYGKERLENACIKLKDYNPTYHNLRDYLLKNMDKLQVIKPEEKNIEHSNIRYLKTK
jgi:transposase